MTSRKRTPDILVDPETNAVLKDAKKPKIDLNQEMKVRCLIAIQQGFFALFQKMFPPITNMDETLSEDPRIYNISVGNHIASIIFTMHNIKRQKARGPNEIANMEKKTAETSFKVTCGGSEFAITTKEATAIWGRIAATNGLEYKNFAAGDRENWYGTMGPSLDMFCAFPFRLNELRLGHNNFPIKKEEGKHKSFPVSKYGLSGAHHVLLEGTSFPPEIRSSIVQSLGPMTSWLCMLRSEGQYRKKYQAAVKKAMAHIPNIDDIIEITKSTKMASEVSTLTTLLAEILLVTTARQATRIFFPLTIFAIKANAEIIRGFNTTGRGGWYLYKVASEDKTQYTMNFLMESEKLQQIVFHAMFGTFKEDLGILEQITGVGSWFTRADLGKCFSKPNGQFKPTAFELVKVNVYSKMSCANQSNLLTGVYNQVATVPCFSGSRTHGFDVDFHEHMEKKKITTSIGKTLPQIVAGLTSTLEELHKHVKSDTTGSCLHTVYYFVDLPT